MRKQLLSVLLVGLLPGLLSACVTHAETVAEHFDRQMKAFAKDCAKTTPRPGSTSCDRLKLKPADPLATEEGRFAHSIKIPNPVPADSGYMPGMTPEQYFDHLCKTEAGEFIFKTVENVEGVFMMRPRIPDGYASEHLYAREDPYGHGLGGATHPEEYYVQPAIGKYEFLEVPIGSGTDSAGNEKYRRFYRNLESHPGRDYLTAVEGKMVRIPYIVAQMKVASLESRYGYTWRGIVRPHDRELGIAGGELIVLDLTTNSVLAVKRGFIRGVFDPNQRTGFSWSTNRVCKGDAAKADHVFIKEVLKPTAKTVAKEK